jgi:K+ transporter
LQRSRFRVKRKKHLFFFYQLIVIYGNIGYRPLYLMTNPMDMALHIGIVSGDVSFTVVKKKSAVAKKLR